jgi:hypothetical protein
LIEDAILIYWEYHCTVREGKAAWSYMLEEEQKTTNWRVVLMQGRQERVAEGSWRRKALFRFVGSLA